MFYRSTLTVLRASKKADPKSLLSIVIRSMSKVTGPTIPSAVALRWCPFCADDS
jgi:hypothetical protein